ncbi:MAG: asparagine synthase (glutamine-hydrolyzing) [Nannocystaceae bacterium]|nr:asparagine synthase (glutamine-hydrolyzing) [Nannocystaceae bacterium]
MVKRMVAGLGHRGPDGEAFVTRGAAVFGFSHLAITSTRGRVPQPIASDDGSILIVVNGEVYNHAELIEHHKLKVSGDGGDCDVLLPLYERHGVKMLKHLDGVFSIAIHDRRSETTYLITDHAGKQPLFYYHRHDELLFCSELGPLAAGVRDRALTIDRTAIVWFLRYRVIPGPYTAYREIRKAQPGRVMEFKRGVKISDSSYVDSNRFFDKVDQSFEESCDHLESLLHDAVAKRLDLAPDYGCALSGGLDSSIIAAMMAEQGGRGFKTFSISFDDPELNERHFAESAARHIGSDHHDFCITPERVLNDLPKILGHFGEPFGFPSGIGCYYLYKMVHEHGLRVAFTGDGSDEFLGGFPRHAAVCTAARGGRAQFIETYGELLAEGFSATDLRRLLDDARLGLGDAFDFNRLLRLNDPREPHPHPLDLSLYFDSQIWFADAQLVKIDRASMANSVELRCPFIDRAVQDFMCRLPPAFKIQHGVEKRILKEIAKKYLPAEIVDRKKLPFTLPLESWLTGKARRHIQATLLSEAALDRGLFDADQLRATVNQYTYADAYPIWTLYVLETWFMLQDVS